MDALAVNPPPPPWSCQEEDAVNKRATHLEAAHHMLLEENKEEEKHRRSLMTGRVLPFAFGSKGARIKTAIVQNESENQWNCVSAFPIHSEGSFMPSLPLPSPDPSFRNQKTEEVKMRSIPNIKC